MSQIGSIVVDTLLKTDYLWDISSFLKYTVSLKKINVKEIIPKFSVAKFTSFYKPYLHCWHVTSDCNPPVNILSIIQLQWWGLVVDTPFVPTK